MPPGLEVFDDTRHTTNIRLKEIMAELGPDRHRAGHTLRGTCCRSGSGRLAGSGCELVSRCLARGAAGSPRLLQALSPNG